MNKAQTISQIIELSKSLIKYDLESNLKDIDTLVDNELVKTFDFIRLAIKGNILKEIIEQQFNELTKEEPISIQQELEEQEEVQSNEQEETDEDKIAEKIFDFANQEHIDELIYEYLEIEKQNELIEYKLTI